MTALKARRSGCQSGFTLVELLVAVAIVAILAAIGISQYAVYKRQATDSHMRSALHNARQSIEIYYERNSFSYVGADSPSALESLGFRPGNTTLAFEVLEISRYVIRSCAEGGSSLSFRYDSDGGLIVGEDIAC